MECNGFLIVYMCNYYWKVRRNTEMTNSIFESNKLRCQQSLLFWKFYLNYVYSTAEKPAEVMGGMLNEALSSTMSFPDKLAFYDLYIQYSSTICTSIQDLTRMKGDFVVWKLAARAEQSAAAEAEEERLSQKRDMPSQSVQQVQPIQPTQQMGMQPTQQMGMQPMQPMGMQPTQQMGMQPGQPQMGMPPMQGVPTDPNSPEYAQYYYQYYQQYYGMNYGQQQMPAAQQCVVC